MAEVSLKDVEKRYAMVPVLSGLNLDIADGEFTVLVGPSGCGKTTTLNMIAGLESITGGTLRIGARDVTTLPPKDRDIAMVFQSYALFPHMTVRDNIAFGMKIRKTPKAEIETQIRQVAQRLRIDDLLDRLPKALSGGQRQRVALGRALVRRPGVFLMDEPLSNLDAKMRIEARSFLTKMHQEVGTTTVYVTHDQAEAMTMGSKIVVMNGGKIQQAAAPLEVYNRPANQFVAGFIGSPAMNFLRLLYDGNALLDQACRLRIAVPECRRAALAGQQGKTVTLGVRPEHFRILQPGAIPGSDSIAFNVDVVQHLGHEILLDLSAGDHRCIARLPPSDRSKLGDDRLFSIDMDHVHYFNGDSGENLIDYAWQQ
ncbi:ABC transporter ATP-binding protein [Mesorhizobium amorphae]|uniref:ABC transporter-like protein n=1 Tax=Mesorhizobium amorphae CCNWGS0123 TaxID=1082933 RepID=G6YL86_9HYPH|nr:ABC transporter ATP-binding protein [Mesorhizobium amorphae]ANT52822.1 glycerol-3-phosphate ABC transporter ATP-binding protein [Mesorhizobium amorphae CCNWGS0123]EHH03002.1 ABC transporter-like protein [Mesorhizobium amorphae CCNWGS0123]GLR45749.1 glycerol-3-phosphate ABC transporter ATP-binding protein [Mesorhizobium amorphae]